MPSGPSLFDDKDGHEPDHRSTAHESGATPDGANTAKRQRRRPPNYLIRRAIVVGGVVAVIAAASIVIGQMIGSESDATTSGSIGSEWNRIVLVDDRTGRVVIDDAEGEELARIESGVRSPSASAIVGSTLLVTSADGAAVVDVDDERVDEYDLGADVVVTPAGSALTMIAPRADRGRALLVHGPSGDVIDTDAFAPVVGARFQFADARSSTSGRAVLVTDAGNFQSVLFSFDRDEPSFFPGLALAVDDELVITAQNIGSNATVNVFDHGGDSIATGRTPSVRAAMITDSGIVLVTVDGEVVVMSSSNGDVSEEGRLGIGAIESGHVATSGDRLVVTGASGSAIVDDTAAVVATLDDQRPTGEPQPQTGSACITTTATTAADDAVSQVAVIDLAEGNVVVEAAAEEPVLTDASGCVAGIATAAGFDLLGAEGVEQRRTGDTLLALSPDGQRVATERDGRVVLLGAASEDPAAQDPIDLGPRNRTVHFTQS
jgi:hypothetical protein